MTLEDVPQCQKEEEDNDVRAVAASSPRATLTAAGLEMSVRTLADNSFRADTFVKAPAANAGIEIAFGVDACHRWDGGNRIIKRERGR